MAEARPQWLYNQSAAIPYRFVDGRLEVALITSRSGRRWVIPKGVIDPGETAVGTAGRETLEEAGLSGRLSDEAVGRYRYEKWGGTCRVQVFLMAVVEVHEDWEEAEVRRRWWLPPEEAAEQVREPELQELIRRVPELIHERGG